MFRPYGASRVRHLRPLATPSKTINTSVIVSCTARDPISTNHDESAHHPVPVSVSGLVPVSVSNTSTPAVAATAAADVTATPPSTTPTSTSTSTSTSSSLPLGSTPGPEAEPFLHASASTTTTSSRCTPTTASTPVSASASTSPALAPQLTPIVRPTRVAVHASPSQPIQAPALARQASASSAAGPPTSHYQHHQNDVSRLILSSHRDSSSSCSDCHSHSHLRPSHSFSSSYTSYRAPYPSLLLHSLHPSSSRPSPRLSIHLGPFHPPASPHHSLQIRGKKTATTIRLSDLPQGLIQPEPQSPSPSSSTPKTSSSSRRRRLDPLPQDDEPVYPTVVLQARQNMRKFDNCVLLTRVGGFYELYFEHADEYGPLLNLKVASKKTNAGPVPMAGFPFFQLDRFLKILVQDLNRHVAVAEEFPNSASDKVKSGGLMHDRRVARIITPGTLIDENFMDPFANNYVMAIHVPGNLPPEAEEEAEAQAESQAENDPDRAVHRLKTSPPSSSTVSTSAHSPLSGAGSPGEDVPLGLAWLDLSTGLFGTQQANLASLPSILSRLCPRELVLEQGLESHPNHAVYDLLDDDHRHLITYSSQGGLLRPSDWLPMLEAPLPAEAAAGFTPEEVLAVGLVLNYVKDRLQGLSMKLQPPLRHQNMQIMAIDKNSLRALEVKQTIRDGAFRGSLLHATRRTVTKNGARLLNEWLSAPSTSLDVITARQDLVARFISDPDLRDSVVLLLRRSHDSQRLVQKFAFGRGDADDLLDLASTITATESIKLLLQNALPVANESSPDCLAFMASRISLDEPLKLARRITDAIDEEGISSQHEVEESEASQIKALVEDVVSIENSQIGDAALPKPKRKRLSSIREYYAGDNDAWIMKPAASRTLKSLHRDFNALVEEKAELSESLRESLGAPSLTLRWSPSLGHIAHVKGKDAKNVNDFKTLSASRSTRSFYVKEWTALARRLDQVRVHIHTEEQAVFTSLRQHVVVNLVKLRRNAAVLAELDVNTSFAKLALEQDLVRPRLNNTTSHTIVGGRHPTVEGGLLHQGRSFVRNDCLVGAPEQGRIWLITGPNMAGKSTFLRQNALITILAQIGCYVPASYAELGIVDAIFSRVGSADNLYRDQSTFMVEMLETAQILKQATPRSFVIMDEIGRGTTPEDGTAVSFACLHHLATINQCRTLFATHFHAVADLASADGLCGKGDSIVQAYCTDVEEDGEGGFIYVHRLRRGINRESHALKVAKLAGLPEQAVNIAQRVLTGQPLESTVPRQSQGQIGTG